MCARSGVGVVDVADGNGGCVAACLVAHGSSPRRPYLSSVIHRCVRLRIGVESGDEVVVLGHFQGTHSGDLASPGGTIPASGNTLNLRFMDYFKVDAGKIVDHQTIFDQVEMLTQLGAMPGA